MHIKKSKFDYLFDTLKRKYKLINPNIPFVGDTTANFVDGNTEILLDASNISFQMNMNYTHKDLQKAYTDQSSREKKQKKKQESSQL